MDRNDTRRLIERLSRGGEIDPADASSLTLGTCTNAAEKPDKEAVSRCIALWAKFYRLEGPRENRNFHRRDIPVQRTFDW
jgi:hypothetical protein